MSSPDDLLARNREWADRATEQNPTLFESLAEGQEPEYLWIGCSDSRVPANQIVDCSPGDLFVHRNVANVIDRTDLNGLSVLQYAVDVLQVDHIIICGHYRCGGVRAALETEPHGIVDHWLHPIKDAAQEYADELEGLDDQARWDRLCELNVEAQVRNVARTPIVQEAWDRGQRVSIHGWVYHVDNGRIHDLEVGMAYGDDVNPIYHVNAASVESV